MRYLVPLYFALLSSCDTYVPSQEPWLGTQPKEATSWDGGTACWIVQGLVPCFWDMSQPDLAVEPPDLSVYNPCVVRASAPVQTGSQQAQQCLTQHTCVDSNGLTYVSSVWDSCHGWSCRWALACDGQIYCAPDNSQNGPEYSDDICETPIVLAPITSSGNPLYPYAGIQKWKDGGSCMDYYLITTQYKSDINIYYHSQGTCNPEFIDFPGIAFWNVDPTPVEPSLFFIPR